MKKVKLLLVLLLFSIIIPVTTFAKGGVTVDKSSISITEGKTASFGITASNAAGKVTIKSADTSIATVNKSSEWVENQTLTVTVSGKKIGSTKITIVVDAATFDEEVVKKTYTVNVKVEKAKSTNNSLSSLMVNGKSVPSFSANKTIYNMVVDNNVTSANITATAADTTAKVSGTGTKTLNVYNNVIRVVVTAENGNKKTYTINIARKDEDGKTSKPSSNNFLKSLTIAGYDINFNKNTLNYELKVPRTVSEIDLKAEAESSTAKVEIDKPDTLKLGNNLITIKVTSETGVTKIYKVLVNRDDGIPTTTIDKFMETLASAESDTIIIEIRDDNNIIPKDIIQKVKEQNKKLIVKKYIDDNLIYAWEIQGKNIITAKDIDTLVEIKSSSDKNINKLTNNGRYVYFKNNLDTSLFNDISLKLYVEDLYNNETIYGYRYKKELIRKYDDLKYTENYIEIKNVEMGEYVLTQTTNYKCTKCPVYIIIICIELLIIIALVTLLILIIQKTASKTNTKSKK